MRLLVTFILILLSAACALAGELHQIFDFDADALQIQNMIGQVEVVPAGGDRIKVSLQVRGKDADQDLITFDTRTDDDGDVLTIQFPIQDHRKYVYPAMGSGSTASFHYGEKRNDSWWRRLFGGDRKITVRGEGDGLEIWVDARVEVPADHAVTVKLGAGAIEARDVDADLVLDNHIGSITARDMAGTLLCDTGSGVVRVIGMEGRLTVDTGSGSVGVSGCAGPALLVDTGSGSVEVADIDCRKLVIDTGSGPVRARGVRADQAHIDTGSGSVQLQLDRMDGGDFRVDTGSGSIILELPADASANIMAENGSGWLSLDRQDAVVKHKNDHEMKLVVGSGKASVDLNAGSGSITVK